MKLELKYLAPYLPYGLKILYNHDKVNTFIEVLNNDDWLYIDDKKDSYYIDIKPILLPLSDLRKEEFNYLYTLLRVHLGKNKRDKLINEGYGITDLPYFIFEQLLENHFDMFNLIKNELSIDVNTL